MRTGNEVGQVCLWLWESVGGRDVRMRSGSVCGAVDVATEQCMYGACLMAVVLVRVEVWGGLLVVKKQTALHWFSFSCLWRGLGPPKARPVPRRPGAQGGGCGGCGVIN